MNEAIRENAAVQLDTGTRLAYERTFLAHERSMMAWVRTALSLISFGFTIAKFFEFLQEKQGVHAPLMGANTVGIIMIAMGLVSMFLAAIHHRQAVEKLRERCPDLPVSPIGKLTLLIFALGILALVGAIIR